MIKDRKNDPERSVDELKRINIKLRSHMSAGARRKLQSKKGASITFGLLLFLICAVISSVVLVAGTSAAGRLSGMSLTEQSYYSVNSTAKVMKDILEDGSATVIKYNDKKYLVSEPKLEEIKDNVPVKNMPQYLACELSKLNGSSGNISMELALSGLKGEGSTAGISDVSITGTVDADENIIFMIKNKDNNDYSMKLVFSTNKKEMPTDITVDGGAVEKGTKIDYSWDLDDAGGE